MSQNYSEELKVGDRVSFTYGHGSIGFGFIKKLYKKKPPVIKFDKQVPPGITIYDIENIQLLRHKQ